MNLQPHSVCLGGHRDLIWNAVTSDLLIAVAYYFIAAALLVMIRDSRFPYKRFFYGFAAFIFCCASTHAAHIVTMFDASPAAVDCQAFLNDLTAVVSFAVAVIVMFSISEITGFLREKSYQVDVRTEQMQDMRQLNLLNAHLLSNVEQRVERMASDAHYSAFLR